MEDCKECDGSSYCQECFGDGAIIAGNGDETECEVCKGDGQCQHCEGSGQEPEQIE